MPSKYYYLGDAGRDFDEADRALEVEHMIQELREQDEAGARELDDGSDDPDWLGGDQDLHDIKQDD